MSRFMHGDSVQVMGGFPDKSIDLILTDPRYLVGFKDRFGRTIANDVNSYWVLPASREMYRVLKDNSLVVSFYGWNRVDTFMKAWKEAGFRVVGHLVFTKPYASKSAFVGYQHESAYLLAKGRPPLPAKPLPDVIPWEYTGIAALCQARLPDHGRVPVLHINYGSGRTPSECRSFRIYCAVALALASKS